MKKIYLLSIAIILCYSGCSQIRDPLRNRMAFQDELLEVEKAISGMEELLYKLTASERINYFMDIEGDLFINNRKLGSLEGAINDPVFRGNKSFRNFTEEEIDRFFELMVFLYKNHIDGAVMELSINKFVFTYRQTLENRYDDLREIIISNKLQDTLSSNFRGTYQVLDSEGNLVLMAPSDAVIR